MLTVAVSASATILSSIITGIVAISVCSTNNRAQNNSVLSVIKSELSALTKQVEKHNSVIARTYKLEQDVAVINAKLEREE